jgi:hypothetical protein
MAGGGYFSDFPTKDLAEFAEIWCMGSIYGLLEVVLYSQVGLYRRTMESWGRNFCRYGVAVSQLLGDLES